MNRLAKVTALAAAALLGAAALVWTLNVRDEPDVRASGAADLVSSADHIERGAYLARTGNCMGCHTVRGKDNYGGGLGIATPFGTVYSTNLTPDAQHGIGSWSPAYFWRAMHNGRSKDGRLLYPAFPYPNYTQITRADSDALFVYLQSLPASSQANQANALRFPYNSQAALAVWRALYFKPQTFAAVPERSASWNQGAYLVKGLGHCSACHTTRNALGATNAQLDLTGGLIPMQNWYAPSLTSPHEAGMQNWALNDIVGLLKTGVSATASLTGPMAEVALNSTQYLSEPDLLAMATYLKELPSNQKAPPAAAPAAPAEVALRGAKKYEQHCAQCHADNGQGVPNAYPALAGNRAVTLTQPANLVQIVLQGAYAPATAGNPRPYGMPPFMLVLDDKDTAAVLTHIRQSWGNQAAEVTDIDVRRARSGSN